MGYTFTVDDLSTSILGSTMFAISREYLATTFLILFLFSTCTVCVGVASAQVSDQRRANRRTFVEGLLRGLLESQLEQAQDPRQQRPGFPRPQAQPLPAVPAPGRRPTPGTINVNGGGQILTVRKTLRDWSDECDHLIDDLRQIELSIPGVRPLLADALQLRVNIDLLARKAQTVPHPMYLVDDFRSVDQQWRLLNYHLQSAPAVLQKSRRGIDLCVGYDKRLGEVLGVAPQFDNQRVLQLASQLATHLDHLSQNLRYEVREQPASTNMIRQCQMLLSVIQQSASVIRRGDYQAATAIYQDGIGQWRQLSRQISKYPSQRLRHDVQDIESIGRQLQEQLFIPYELDREYLAQLSSNVGVSSAQVFRQITLQDLLSMENPADILVSAKTFQQQCDRFSGLIRNNGGVGQLATEFGQFESNWNGMFNQCSSLNNPSLRLELDEINYSMQTLHEAFGTQPLLDHGSMLRVAADLEQLSHELENAAVGAPATITRPVKNFHQRCYDLHNRTMTDRLYDPKPAQLNKMFKSWIQFKDSLVGYAGTNAPALNAYRRQIEPLMVKLQVVYHQ